MPSDNSQYFSDICLSFTIRLILYSSILLVVAIVIAGCSRVDEGGNPFSREGRISSTDQEARTRNSLPQGGENEKSDCAPRKLLE